MKRDMDIVKRVLLVIEEKYKDVALYDWELSIDDLDKQTIAYHCKILYDGGLISDYKAQYADGEIWSFGVSSLTWEGHDFLDKIRDDSIWSKTKETIKSKGLPMTLDVVKVVASSIIEISLKAAIQGTLGI